MTERGASLGVAWGKCGKLFKESELERFRLNNAALLALRQEHSDVAPSALWQLLIACGPKNMSDVHVNDELPPDLSQAR